MNFADYQRAALRTFKAELTQRNLLANGALGLCGEAGEVADLIKKHIYPSKPGDAMQIHRIGDELGDVLWYLAILAEGVGVSLDQIAQQNIEKLAARHGLGASGQATLSKLLRGESVSAETARRVGRALGVTPPPRRLVRRCMTAAQAAAWDVLTHAERDERLGMAAGAGTMASP